MRRIGEHVLARLDHARCGRRRQWEVAVQRVGEAAEPFERVNRAQRCERPDRTGHVPGEVRAGCVVEGGSERLVELRKARGVEALRGGKDGK
jgi:hypothetical protein